MGMTIPIVSGSPAQPVPREATQSTEFSWGIDLYRTELGNTETYIFIIKPDLIQLEIHICVSLLLRQEETAS